MASIDWPSSLPQSLQVTGYSEGPQNQFVRSNMDAGPPKQRLRFTATFENIKGFVVVDSTDLATFKTWWTDTAMYGSLPFNWNRPIEGTACVMRNKAPYQIKLHNNMPNWYEIHLDLEILP